MAKREIHQMKKSTITATFKSDVEKVWNVVTDNRNYTWRTDLSKIICAEDGKRFTEYAGNGFPTLFTITYKTPFERYEFDMENKNMTGHWTGIFTKKHDGGTQIDFTEEVEVENPIMKLLAGTYLKKQQNTYVNDLRTALGE